MEALGGAMRRFRILGRLMKEMFQFMNEDKLWWMSPILILLLVLSVFIIFVEGSALAPLIYAVF
jgi:membrane glycosyltransferase